MAAVGMGSWSWHEDMAGMPSSLLNCAIFTSRLPLLPVCWHIMLLGWVPSGDYRLKGAGRFTGVAEKNPFFVVHFPAGIPSTD